MIKQALSWEPVFCILIHIAFLNKNVIINKKEDVNFLSVYGEVKIMLYDYLKNNYMENEPIILSEIQIEGMSDVNLRQQIKKLADEEKIKRYDTGIYFIPKASIFKSGSQLSLDNVIQYKYLQDANGLCGYVTGLAFANQLGVTTQVPMKKEIVTNKATKDYRETTLAKSQIIIRKPRTKVTEENYRILQLLDLVKDIDMLAELADEKLNKVLIEYMKKVSLTFADLDAYLDCYPERIYKNLYKVGLLNGILTS